MQFSRIIIALCSLVLLIVAAQTDLRNAMETDYSKPMIRHSTTTEKHSAAHMMAWMRKAVHELRTEFKEVAKNVNLTSMLHEIHQLNNHVKRLTLESANCMSLAQIQEARIERMGKQVEDLTYQLKNTNLQAEELSEQVVDIGKEVNHQIQELKHGAENNANNLDTVKTTAEPSLPQKHHKLRHNRLSNIQTIRLSHNQDQLDTNQQSMQLQIHELRRRIDHLEKPWTLLTARVDLLQLETKVFSDRLNNNTLTLSDFEKVHASMLELREDLEAMENKVDTTIPEFRKEISKLDINQAQINAQYSYVKEDTENIRKSVKAIAVSVSNTQDKADADREELKKINDVMNDLTVQSKNHFFRLNDHILKTEANHEVSGDHVVTQIVPLPELMGEIKDLRPVEREYEDLVAQLPKDCSGISGPPGSYIIRPDHTTIDTWCVEGSTVAQRRYNGSVEFNRKFTEYVHGFGDPASEYWLGLETMHQITADNCTSLRIEMTDIYGAVWNAQYETFFVGSADTGYVLNVTGFTGNASDALDYQNHMEFSAIDRDRDISNTHCAGNYEGGWWFSHCQHVNINGKYILGLTWFDSNHNEWIAVATSEMRMFRRPGCQ